MATPNNDIMTKLAAMERGSANINRLIIANLRNYSELGAAVQEFLANPGEESGEALDIQFASCEQGFDAIRAAVANVAMVAIDAEQIDDEGKLPVSGVDEEDGVRLM
jgi:hypothetical protein